MDELFNLLADKAPGVPFKDVPFFVKFMLDTGDMEFQGKDMKAAIVADAGKVFHAADIAVSARGVAHEGGFFAHKAFRERAGINEYLEYARKASVVFGQDKNEFVCGRDFFLDRPEAGASLPV